MSLTSSIKAIQELKEVSAQIAETEDLLIQQLSSAFAHHFEDCEV